MRAFVGSFAFALVASLTACRSGLLTGATGFGLRHVTALLRLLDILLWRSLIGRRV